MIYSIDFWAVGGRPGELPKSGTRSVVVLRSDCRKEPQNSRVSLIDGGDFTGVPIWGLAPKAKGTFWMVEFRSGSFCSLRKARAALEAKFVPSLLALAWKSYASKGEESFLRRPRGDLKIFPVSWKLLVAGVKWPSTSG